MRMPKLQAKTLKHRNWFASQSFALGSLLWMLVWLAGCEENQPRVVNAIPWAQTGQWLRVDTHTHTRFSDGSTTVDELAQMAIDSGCDALAITDHSDSEGTASRAYLSEIERADSHYPALTVLSGMEWNIPPYGGREHVTMLLEPGLARRAMGDFKARFDRQQTAEEALTWLRAQMGNEDAAALIYNHPSRKDEGADENLTDMQAWRAVNSLFVGFAGAPGHQKRTTNIGAYKKRFRPVDRWDPVAAEVGGTWDTMLERGEDIWAALAPSDYHNEKGDYAPCAFARTHVLVGDASADGVIKALRAGSFWADHGLILDTLTLDASVRGLDRPAIPGEALSVQPDDIVTLRLALQRGPGASNAPLKIEVIENCTTGTPTLSSATTLGPGEDSFETLFGNLQKGLDRRSCYLRARVRKEMGGEPDLMAYTNPIRFRIDKASVFALFSMPRVSPLLISVVAISVTVLASALLVFGFRRRRVVAESAAAPTTRASFDYTSQLLGTSIQATDSQSPIELGTRGRPTVRLGDAQLEACRLLLNDEIVDTRTRDSDELSGEVAVKLQSLLLEERKHPLDVETERRIDVSIEYAAEETHCHTLNFYYRVGNNRATNHSFEESIDVAIWWYRFLASRLQPIGQTQEPQPEVSDVDTAESTQAEADTGGVAANISIADELERLVNLKQEGLLSDQEFAIAKAKLLQ